VGIITGSSLHGRHIKGRGWGRRKRILGEKSGRGRGG